MMNPFLIVITTNSFVSLQNLFFANTAWVNSKTREDLIYDYDIYMIKI